MTTNAFFKSPQILYESPYKNRKDRKYPTTSHWILAAFRIKGTREFCWLVLGERRNLEICMLAGAKL